MATQEEHHASLVFLQPVALRGLMETVHLRFNADDFSQLTVILHLHQPSYRRIETVHIAK